QLDLLALGRVDHFSAFENVALRLGDSHGLPFLVDLRQSPKPRFIEANPAVVLADDRLVNTASVTRETDIVRCRIQLSSRNDYLCALVPLVAQIAGERLALAANPRLIP